MGGQYFHGGAIMGKTRSIYTIRCLQCWKDPQTEIWRTLADGADVTAAIVWVYEESINTYEPTGNPGEKYLSANAAQMRDYHKWGHDATALQKNYFACSKFIFTKSAWTELIHISVRDCPPPPPPPTKFSAETAVRGAY